MMDGDIVRDMERWRELSLDNDDDDENYNGATVDMLNVFESPTHNNVHSNVLNVISI